MKRLILLTALFVGISGFAAAQTNRSTTAVHTKSYKAKAKAKTAKKSSSKQKKTITKVRQQKKTFVVPEISNRPEVKWRDGQQATVTGHEAAPVNSESFLSLKKDTIQRGRKKQ